MLNFSNDEVIRLFSVIIRYKSNASAVPVLSIYRMLWYFFL